MVFFFGPSASDSALWEVEACHWDLCGIEFEIIMAKFKRFQFILMMGNNFKYLWSLRIHFYAVEK
jgi:hypothetical protein